MLCFFLFKVILNFFFLGFIFWKGSKRNVDADKFCEIVKAVRQGGFNCGFVGVIVNPEDEEAKAAFRLVREGILDKIQPETKKVEYSFVPAKPVLVQKTKFRTDSPIYSRYSKQERKLIGRIYAAITNAIPDEKQREALISKIEEDITK